MQRFAHLASVAALAMGLVGSASAAEPALERIAVVDMQRCLLETKEGKRAKSELEKTFSKGQARLERKAEDLQKRASDLQAKAAMLAEAELRKRQEELMRAQAELEQLTGELQEDVSEKEALLTEKIYKNVATIVKQIAVEDDVQVVLVRSDLTVLYVEPKLDVTNRVIVRYDKEHP